MLLHCITLLVKSTYLLPQPTKLYVHEAAHADMHTVRMVWLLEFWQAAADLNATSHFVHEQQTRLLCVPSSTLLRPLMYNIMCSTITQSHQH